MDFRDQLFFIRLSEAMASEIPKVLKRIADKNNMVKVLKDIQLPADPKFRQLQVGEFGYFLADLETRHIHISNMFVDGYPVESKRFTTSTFDQFVNDANTLFTGSDLLRVIEEGLRIHQGFFEGTF